MDTKQILRSVRALGGQSFKPGQEKELAAKLTQAELDSLVAARVITGSWKSTLSGERSSEEKNDEHPKSAGSNDKASAADRKPRVQSLKSKVQSPRSEAKVQKSKIKDLSRTTNHELRITNNEYVKS